MWYNLSVKKSLTGHWDSEVAFNLISSTNMPDLINRDSTELGMTQVNRLIGAQWLLTPAGGDDVS